MQKSIAKNIIYKILLNVFNVILPILVGPYAYRTLGASSMGKVNFSETIFTYFFIFAVFGIHQYGLREISAIKDNKKKSEQLFTSLFILSIFTNLLTFGAYLLFSYFGYAEKGLFYILLIFGFNFIANIFYVEWLNEAYENFDFITLKTIIVKLIYVVMLFIFVQTAQDFYQFTGLLVLSNFLNNIISYIYIRRTVKFDFSNITIKKHLKPLLLIAIFSNAHILYTHLDRFFLGEYVGEKYVSFYVMAFQIMSIINLLMLSVIQVTLPRLSYLSESDDETAYDKLLNTISQLYFITLFPAAIGIIIVSNLIVVIYGGAQYAAAGPTLAIFSVYMVILGIQSILGNQIMYIKRKEHILVRALLVFGVINIILKIILLKITLFTPTTATLTTTIATLLLVVYIYFYIKKSLKVNYHLFTMANFKYLLYSLTFFPISYVVQLYVSGTIPLFLALVVTNGLAYTLLLFLTKDEILFLALSKLTSKFKKS
ncbi:flippase [Bacillus cereus]|uniref:oligosaccharide flippase family protein n=1 Tax=Bacillus cereus TaxID=1396 RepID=UPI000BF50D93|nr:oligosaccharide flippase family protein [Bacillus cereus]MCC2492836.1 oligosaccharide flippase family protein [Bacillus cereus]PER15613.1 flippase [Bacillus cereus]PGL07715.1 flippase [Bacillus cereus]HDR6288912.1 oligosaccharide flippase family protein [Bacillus cereus]